MVIVLVVDAVALQTRLLVFVHGATSSSFTAHLVHGLHTSICVWDAGISVYSSSPVHAGLNVLQPVFCM